MKDALSVIVLLTDVFTKMGKTRDKIFPRDCFNCGNPMKRTYAGSITLACEDCEIWENGTISGRFPAEFVPYHWGEERIEYTDHGSMCFPSPDSAGYHETNILVPHD